MKSITFTQTELLEDIEENKLFIIAIENIK